MTWKWRHISVMASKSVATWLSVQQFVPANNKESTKVPDYWSFEKIVHQLNPHSKGRFPSQRISDMDSVTLILAFLFPWPGR